MIPETTRFFSFGFSFGEALSWVGPEGFAEGFADRDRDRMDESDAASSAYSGEILFLGTGSAEPSKYRGASGVLCRLPPSGGGGYVLLDAGEGAYGAMMRYLGAHGAQSAVSKLKAVWVSHHHADHMLGLPGVLAARPKVSRGGVPHTGPRTTPSAW